MCPFHVSRGRSPIIDPLQALPERLQEAPSARVIDAAENQITKLPSWIGTFGGTLTRLVLSSNLLQSLPAEIGQLQNLKTLLIDNNRINALPSELKLPRLELLDVSHNNLETLSAGISSLKNLRHLRASHNHLGVLPLQLGSCSALQHADFAGNALMVSASKCHPQCPHRTAIHTVSV